MREHCHLRAPEYDDWYVAGDAFAPPFPDGSFERVFTGHFVVVRS